MARAANVGRVDRRALLTSGVASALLAASGVSLAAQPRRGGHLRVAIARPESEHMLCAHLAVFDTLTEVAADGTLREDLAQQWRSDGEARRWQFDLRRDVQFHDGTAFGATDVAASLTRGGYQVRVAGTHRIEVSLTQSDPHLPYRFTDPRLAIGPAGDLSAGIGTGLYAQRRLTAGRDFLGTRVAQHHKDGVAGWVDQFELIVIPKAQVRAEAVLDGFVDIAALPDIKALQSTREELRFFPSPDAATLVARRGVGIPAKVSQRAPLDDGRISARWWIG